MQNIVQREYCLPFIFGGCAELSIMNVETKNKFSYKIQKSKQDNLYFVHIISPHGMTRYAGVIVYKNNKYEFHKGKNGTISQSNLSIIALVYTINHLLNNTLSNKVIIYHNGRCGICGRRLTDMQSIQRGFGKYCWEKYVKK